MSTNKKRIWGWMFFDWASQPYHTLLITFIFGPYFVAEVMNDPVLGQEYWGWMLTISGILIALFAPVLGSVVDNRPSKNPWMILFSLMIIVGSAYLWLAVPNSSQVVLILLFFGIGLMGIEFATIITNSMLPDLGPKRDVGQISGNGWAFGYLGGIIALAIMMLFFAETETGKTYLNIDPLFGLNPENREGTRFVGPFCAFWYLIFMIPFFMWVRPDKMRVIDDTKSNKGNLYQVVSADLRTILANFSNVAKSRSLAAYLLSSMFYRDALAGIFAFGGIYAAGVLGWSITQLGIFGILALVFGIIATIIGGYYDKKIGPKIVILISIIVLILTGLIILSTSLEEVLFIPVKEGSSLPHISFWICGCLIGAVGGTLQASSRTMMVIQAIKGRYTEAFGLYALAGKATSFLAPFLIAVVTNISGDQRLGISPVILLAMIGLILLYWVKPDGDENLNT
ncbi:MAG: MFS transporter [Rhodobacteraceae bacterium]|nr:MFS transporter [Paracoccaceae bacterium]